MMKKAGEAGEKLNKLTGPAKYGQIVNVLKGMGIDFNDFDFTSFKTQATKSI